MSDTLQSCRALGRSREPPAFTFFGCTSAEGNSARSCETRQSGSSPGVSSFFAFFVLFCRYPWVSKRRPGARPREGFDLRSAERARSNY